MNYVIVIVGPTAVGKTHLSVELAKQLNTDVISADSMQFYRNMSIGTAKITNAEMDGVTHHLIDILDPSEEFSVGDYQRIVRSKIDELLQSGKDAILVGGSGLYLQGAIYDYTFSGDKRDDDFEKEYNRLSNAELHAHLMTLNPTLAQSIHENNRRRLLRSIQISSVIDQNTLEQGKKLYYPNVKVIGLSLDREILYERINQRVDKMISNGLVDEVKRLYDQKIEGQSVQAIGYKELYLYFKGEVSFDEAVELIKLHSRRYAKRQLTWFHNKMNTIWYDTLNTTTEQIIGEIVNSK